MYSGNCWKAGICLIPKSRERGEEGPARVGRRHSDTFLRWTVEFAKLLQHFLKNSLETNFLGYSF